MAALVGDIWKIRRPRDFVVVPTNIGWIASGKNIMGRGIAREAAQRYADIPAWYGALCRQHGAGLPVCSHDPYRLIFYPTKPLASNPALSWKHGSSLDLVRKSRVELVRLLSSLPRGGRVLLPAVGCGNGGLDPQVIVPELLELSEYNPQVQVVLDEKTAAVLGIAVAEAPDVSAVTSWGV